MNLLLGFARGAKGGPGVRLALDAVQSGRFGRVLVACEGEDPLAHEGGPGYLFCRISGGEAAPPPFPPASQSALDQACAAGLPADEPLLLAHAGAVGLSARDLAAAADAYADCGGPALLSVISSRDHPCQLLEPADLAGYCLLTVLPEGRAADPAGPTPGGVLPFAWANHAPAGGPREAYALGPHELSWRPEDVCSAQANEDLWAREGAEAARPVLTAAAASVLAREWGTVAEHIRGWSPGVARRGLRALLLRDGGDLLRIRLERPTGQQAFLEISPLGGQGPHRIARLAIPAGAREFSCRLDLAEGGWFCCVTQATQGSGCDFMHPYAPRLPLWVCDALTGESRRADTGQLITGRQQFPEVYEPDGVLAVLGPGLRRLEDALCLPRLGYWLSPARVRRQGDPWLAASAAAALHFTEPLPGVLCPGPMGEAGETLRALLAEAATPGNVSADALLAEHGRFARELERQAFDARILRDVLQRAEPFTAPMRKLQRDSLAMGRSVQRELRSVALPMLERLRSSGRGEAALGLAERLLSLRPGDEEVVDALRPLPGVAGTQARAFSRRYALRPAGAIRHPGLSTPYGLAADPGRGVLAVANFRSGLVSFFDPRGGFLGERPTGRQGISGLGFDGEGGLWVCCAGARELIHLPADEAAPRRTVSLAEMLGPDNPWQHPLCCCVTGGLVHAGVMDAEPERSGRLVSFDPRAPEGSVRVHPRHFGMPGGVFPWGESLIVVDRLPAAVWSVDSAGGEVAPLAHLADCRQVLGAWPLGEALYLSCEGGLLKLGPAGGRIFFADARQLCCQRPTGLACFPAGEGGLVCVGDFSGDVVRLFEVESETVAVGHGR